MTRERPLLLNVDDYAAGRYASTRVLKHAGFDVVEAETGERALQLVREVEPDLIVLDVNLPDINGIELCRVLKSDPACATIPVLQMSASAISSEQRVRGLEQGADAYLAQPVEPRELIATVAALLRIRRSEDALRKSEERFRFLSDAGAVLSASLDYGDNLERLARLAVPRIADRFAVDMLDDEGQIERCTPEDLGHGLDPHVVASALRAREPLMLEGVDGAVRCAIVVPLISRDQVFGSVAAGISDPQRRYDAADVAFFNELAARVATSIDNARLYDAALVASKAKSDFLAVMSHELRTPMNAIIGYTDLLDAELTGPLNAAQHEQLSRITMSSRHLLSIIDQILTFSRVEAGMEVNFLEEVDAAGVVREAAELVMPLAQRKGLQLVLDLPDGIMLRTDVGKVRQIVLNLLSNAVKFTEHGGVELRLMPTADGAQIIVRDSGIGIARENLQRVFDPFWQVEQSRSRKVGGSGLGLGVTRSLALLLGGDIDVTSEPGRGSTFTVRLPAVAREMPQATRRE